MPAPPTPITPWAPDANYPGSGHAWGGQPTKVTPAYVEFQPSPAFAPSAQEFNAILHARDVAMNTAIAYVNSAAYLAGALNWNPYNFAVVGSTIQFTCAWDAFTGSWLSVVANGIGGLNMMATKNGGKTWREVNPDFATAYFPVGGQAMAVNPNNGAVVVVRFDPGTSIPYVSSKTAFGAAWVDLSQSAIAHGTVVGTCFFAPYSGGGSGVFGFVGATGASVGSYAFSLTNDGHGSWSSGTLPSNWTTIVGSSAGYLSAGTATQTLIAFCGLTPGSGDRSLLLQHPSLLDITPAFLASGAEQIRGIAWGATDALWAVATVDASGTTRVHTSPDLVTWTTAATLTGTVCAGIAVMGTVWALYAYQSGVDPTTNVVLVTASITAGTPLWTAADFYDITKLPLRTFPVGTFLSNGSQFLAAEMDNSVSPNTGSVTISQRAAVAA